MPAMPDLLETGVPGAGDDALNLENDPLHTGGGVFSGPISSLAGDDGPLKPPPPPDPFQNPSWFEAVYNKGVAETDVAFAALNRGAGRDQIALTNSPETGYVDDIMRVVSGVAEEVIDAIGAALTVPDYGQYKGQQKVQPEVEKPNPQKGPYQEVLERGRSDARAADATPTRTADVTAEGTRIAADTVGNTARDAAKGLTDSITPG